MDTSNILKIGNRIKTLRESNGLTQLDLSKALNVKRQTVAQWENGERDLKTGYIIALANLFNVTTDYLLCVSDNASYDTGGIGKELNLSDLSISVLKSYPRNGLYGANIILNFILEDDRFKLLLHELSLMISAYITKPDCDDWIVSKYRATETFNNILKNLIERYYNTIMEKMNKLKTDKEREEFKNKLLECAEYQYRDDKNFYFYFDHENKIFDQ